MNEAQFTTKLLKWIENKWPKGLSAGIEVKIVDLSKRKSFSLLTWIKNQNHQSMFLRKCGKVLAYKIPDDTAYGVQRPFDITVHSQDPGYLIIYFYKRGEKKFYMLEISKIDLLMKEGLTLIDEEVCKYHAFQYKIN